MAKKVEPFEKTSLKLSRNEIVINNFLGGLCFTLGATLGLALLFTILGIIGKNVNWVPVVGSFISDVINYILATNPNV